MMYQNRDKDSDAALLSSDGCDQMQGDMSKRESERASTHTHPLQKSAAVMGRLSAGTTRAMPMTVDDHSSLPLSAGDAAGGTSAHRTRSTCRKWKK
jgi:hypothetical protein